MALSFNTVTRTRATVVAAGTAVSPGTAIPDNCHTIIFLNRDAAGGDTALIGQGTLPAALADDGTSTALPPGASLTWEVGYLSQRIDTLQNLIYDCDANAVNVDITYLCTAGKV
jgi:hypothetical protein